MIFSAIVGALKGFVTTLLAWTFGAETSLEYLWTRTLQASLLGLVTIPALAVLASSYSKIQAEREALIAQRVRQSQLGDRVFSDVAIGEVTKLAEAIKRIRTELASSTAKSVPVLLNEVVQLQIKPLSRKLWEQHSKDERDYKFTTLAKLAVRARPLPAVEVALIISVGIYLPYAQYCGALEALFRSCLTGAMIWVFYYSASLLSQRKPVTSTVYFLALNLVCSVVIVWVSDEAFGVLGNYPMSVSVGVLFIWITQTGFMTSFLQRIASTRDSIRAELAEISQQMGINEAVARAQSQLHNRELANQIHGEVQNKLLLLAIKADRGHSEGVDEELARIESLLIHVGQRGFEKSLTAHLAELRNTWAGFAQLEFDTRAMCQDCDSLGALSKIVDEGVNNAIRHGLAQLVQITITCEGFEHSLTIADDGIGPRSGNRGLGSELFNSVSIGDWSLDPRESGGSTLRLKITTGAV